PVPVEEPEIRHPPELHRRGDPHADARHHQPEPDGGAALHPVRGRHHRGAHLRPARAETGRSPGSRGRDAAHRRRRSVSPMDFTLLDLPEAVMAGIREAGFITATPIQEAALPLALKGKDVAGQSQTGTGKTAAFLIAAFTRCLRTRPPARSGTTAPRILIVAPTRELVVQIEADARLLGAHTGLEVLAVYGGVD